MASIIEGYNYDIFISYRQKDNKGDHWVSEFVEALKTELESTFKEEISVYFDINPHDGLLETHDVDASLKEKLKCLIFIPIISRTYCDPKSFAWEHEFKAFVEMASKDKFGFKINLSGGNVANRVLPIKIHELEKSDLRLCEELLEGKLRSVDFVYKAAGINRPLRPVDENRGENLNKTLYRDQVNKVANSLREIIKGLRNEIEDNEPTEHSEHNQEDKKTGPSDKSIIVLPFANLSSDPDQEYFSDGLTEEIITDLSYIHDLLVISRSSAMTFKGSKKTIPEISREVNVRYVLEGSVRKSGNNIKIVAQLIDAVKDTHLWAEKYNGTLDDIFSIQEKVSESITDSLKIKLSKEDKIKIYDRSIDDAFAYDLYLRAYADINSWSAERIIRGLKSMEECIQINGPNAIVYAGIALACFQLANMGIEQKENYRISEENVLKALEINPDLAEAHFVYGNLYIASDAQKAARHFSQAYNKKQAPEILPWFAWSCFLVGKTEIAISMMEQFLHQDPMNKIYPMEGFINFILGRFDQALPYFADVLKISPGVSMWKLWYALALLYNNKRAQTMEFLNNEVSEDWEDSMSGLLCFLKYALREDDAKTNEILNPKLITLLKSDCQFSWHMASIYSYLNELNKSLEWVENATMQGFINYPMLNELDPLLKNIRSDERYQKLMKKVKFEWENFEV